MKNEKTGKVKRSLFQYYGGKWRIAPWIISFFPEHSIYVEPYGGACSVLLRKDASKTEVYNDLDDDLYNLFQVIRENPKKLIQEIKNTPYSRKEFENSYIPSKDKIERARRTIVRNFMSFGSGHNTAKKTGFKSKIQSSIGKQWREYPEQLNLIIERLKNVIIEHKNALDLITQHDSSETLFYLDPPYLESTRYGTNKHKEYTTELSDKDHITLCKKLLKCKGYVVLSGYDNPIYNEYLSKWHKKKKLSYSLQVNPKMEVLWINPKCYQAQNKKSKLMDEKKEDKTLNGISSFEDGLLGLEGTKTSKKTIINLMLKAGEIGQTKIEKRCKAILPHFDKHPYIKIEKINTLVEIPENELKGLTESLPLGLAGVDEGVKLNGEQYYQELISQLVKHIRSNKVQFVSSYVKPKSKNIIQIQVQNGVSNNVYEGLMNRMNLSHYHIPYFATRKNIADKKGKLKPKSRGEWVYFQRVFIEYDGKKTNWDEIKKKRETGDFDIEKYKRYAIFKKYRVYNFQYIEGDFFEKKIQDFEKLVKDFEKQFPKPPIRIKTFIDGLPQLKIKRIKNPPAYYAPLADHIAMPPLAFFGIKNRYFQTLFHEMGHWTGHNSRLNRLTNSSSPSEPYAKEELVAELCGYFLVHEFKLMDSLIKDKTASYLKGWSGAIRGKKAKKFVWAYKKAVEATEYLLQKDKNGVPLYIRNLEKEQKTKSKRVKSNKKSEKKENLKTEASLSAVPSLFTPATQVVQDTNYNTFRLEGEIGKFLQDLQRYRLAIVISGDPHAGKSELVCQIINAFLSQKFKCGFFDLEQGGLVSKDTQGAFNRNIEIKNKKYLFVSSEAPKGIETIKNYANQFDIVIIDSWQKLNIPNPRFDELRTEFPNTIFIVIFQQNGTGGTRGGVTVDYDTPIAIKVHKIDNSFVNNYAELIKNRGNRTGLKYNISKKKIIES